MTSPQKLTVILSNSSAWDEWLEIIKTKAVGGEIWEFVNPATAKDTLPALTEPAIPTPQNVNPNATTFTQLDDDEKEELRIRQFSYKRKIAAYDRQKAAIASLPSYIQETISRTYLTYTFDCDTPYDMLTALKKRVAPTDQAKKIETWLQQREKTYKECK